MLRNWAFILSFIFKPRTANSLFRTRLNKSFIYGIHLVSITLLYTWWKFPIISLRNPAPEVAVITKLIFGTFAVKIMTFQIIRSKYLVLREMHIQHSLPYLANTRSGDGKLHQSQTFALYYATDNHTRILGIKCSKGTKEAGCCSISAEAARRLDRRSPPLRCLAPSLCT